MAMVKCTLLSSQVVVRALPSQDVPPFLCALLEQLQTTSLACGPTALLWFEVAVQMQGLELRDKVGWGSAESLVH